MKQAPIAKHGAFDFLPKPFTCDELLSSVARACRAVELRLTLGARGPGADHRGDFHLGVQTWARPERDGTVSARGDGTGAPDPRPHREASSCPRSAPNSARAAGWCAVLTADGLAHNLWSPLGGRVLSCNDRPAGPARIPARREERRALGRPHPPRGPGRGTAQPDRVVAESLPAVRPLVTPGAKPPPGARKPVPGANAPFSIRDVRRLAYHRRTPDSGGPFRCSPRADGRTASSHHPLPREPARRRLGAAGPHHRLRQGGDGDDPAVRRPGGSEGPGGGAAARGGRFLAFVGTGSPASSRRPSASTR